MLYFLIELMEKVKTKKKLGRILKNNKIKLVGRYLSCLKTNNYCIAYYTSIVKLKHFNNSKAGSLIN